MRDNGTHTKHGTQAVAAGVLASKTGQEIQVGHFDGDESDEENGWG